MPIKIPLSGTSISDINAIKVKTDNLPSTPSSQPLIDAKLGVPTDIWNGESTLLGYSNATYKHIHNPGYVYPADGTVKTVTSSATEGEFGTFVDAFPANTISYAFDIHWVSVTDISANGVYILELHRLDGDGVSEALLCQLPFVRSTATIRIGEVFSQIPIQPANARIGARVLKSTAGAGSISFICHYHDYED